MVDPATLLLLKEAIATTTLVTSLCTPLKNKIFGRRSDEEEAKDGIKSILLNIDQIQKDISLALSTLEHVEKKMDAVVLSKIQSSFVFLTDALNESNKNKRDQMLHDAYTGFTELAALPPDRHLKITNSEINFCFVVCLGCLGRFILFAIDNKISEALKVVYECLQSHPEEGIKLFGDYFMAKQLAALNEVKLMKGGRIISFSITPELITDLENCTLLAIDEGIIDRQIFLSILSLRKDEILDEIRSLSTDILSIMGDKNEFNI